MYVHYEINTAYGNTKILVQSVMSDLANVFNGNFTNTSSFNPASCIISASEFYGSTNTTIYPVANVVWTTNATATVPDVLTFNKRHNQANSTYIANTYQQFGLYWDLTYGPRIRIGNSANTNFTPDPVSNSYWINSVNNTALNSNNSAVPTNINRILIYLSDTYVAMQFVSGYTVGTGAIFDWAVSDSDNSGYQANNYLYPGIRLFSYNAALGATYGGSANDWFLIAQSEYLNMNNIVSTNNGIRFSANVNYGLFSNSNANNFPTLYPQPYMAIQSLPKTTAGAVNALIPVQLQPNFGFATYANTSTRDMSTWSYFPNLYRTSDNIGATGDIVTFGSNNYMVLMLHKTGGNTFTDVSNNRNACYLVPQTINGK